MVKEKLRNGFAGISLIPNRQQFDAPERCVFCANPFVGRLSDLGLASRKFFFNILNGFRLPLFLPMLVFCFKQK